MGVAQLKRLLGQHKRVAIDTSIFIYQLQAHPKYSGLTEEIFSWMERPRAQAVTSTLTMTELLVQPYRDGDRSRADEIYALLTTFPNLTWVQPSLEIADAAARIRAKYGLRTPDALQAGTAMLSGASGLLTNDASFQRITEIEVLLMDELV